MKKVLLGIILFSAILGVYLSRTRDWAEHVVPPENIGELVEPFADSDTEELQRLLHIPYRFLDEGGQSYVFVSEDGRHVLKLFKFHRFKPPWFTDWLPESNFRKKQIARRKKKLDAVLTGHQVAYALHREESGIKYMQLVPSGSDYPATLFDKDGRQQTVDLGKMAFLIQERGEILSTVFAELLEKGDLEAVNEKIAQTLALYRREYAKGIYDTDHGVMHNIGFVGERPVHLDVGKFVRDERMKDPAFHRQDLHKVAGKIVVWAEKNYPQYSQDISLAVEQALRQ